MSNRNTESDSNPNSGPTAKPEKLAKVPRPKGDYLAATVENEGNKIVKIADAPSVHDRLPATPESALDRLQKTALHGHHFPGRPLPKASAVEDAKENVGAAARARKPQLGSNGMRGN